MTEKQKLLLGTALSLFVAGYFGLTAARSAEWVPETWSLMPVVETAWLNFLVVLAAILWMRIQKIPLSHIGLGPFLPSRTLLMWVLGTMAVDSIVVGIASPVLANAFGEAPQVARFADLPGNLPLLLKLLPVAWLIAAFGEEFFFRGFLLTAIAGVLGGSRAAWATAVVAQAVAFGLIHAYQGPAQAISIGIGGAQARPRKGAEVDTLSPIHSTRIHNAEKRFTTLLRSLGGPLRVPEPDGATWSTP